MSFVNRKRNRFRFHSFFIHFNAFARVVALKRNQLKFTDCVRLKSVAFSDVIKVKITSLNGDAAACSPTDWITWPDNSVAVTFAAVP